MSITKQDISVRNEVPAAGHSMPKTDTLTAPAANDPVHEALATTPPAALQGQRAKLAAAFQALGVGVDAQIAYWRSRQWFCSNGGEWTRLFDEVNQSPKIKQAVLPVEVLPGQRTRLVAAFWALGVSTTPRAAYQRSKLWFRSSAAAWTRALA